MACLARTSFFLLACAARACPCARADRVPADEVWREEKRVERVSKIVVRIDVVVHGRQPSTQPNNIHGHTAPGHASPRVAQYRQNVKLAATLLYILRVQLGADLRGFLLAHGADALISVSHAPKGERGALAEGDEVLLTDEGGHDRTWFRSGSGVWGKGNLGTGSGLSWPRSCRRPSRAASIGPRPTACAARHGAGIRQRPHLSTPTAPCPAAGAPWHRPCRRRPLRQSRREWRRRRRRTWIDRWIDGSIDR